MNTITAHRNTPPTPRPEPALLPPVDVVEDSTGITLYADLPGQAHRPRLDGLALAHRPHLLGRLGLHVDGVHRQPSACAMRSRIAGMCGAIFGACATMVLSTLPIS
jgi:hypothetical protein